MPKYDIVYSPKVEDEHLEWLEDKHQTLALDEIDAQLSYEPLKETKNRKPMVANVYGPDIWEIRFGPSNKLRALYNVDQEQRLVEVVAVGIKRGNKLFIAGKEFGKDFIP